MNNIVEVELLYHHSNAFFKNSKFILNLISPLYLVYYRLFILVFNNFEIFLEDYYFKNQIGYKYKTKVIWMDLYQELINL